MRYDYKCLECDVVTEKIHSIHDKPTYLCEICETELVHFYGASVAIKWKGHWQTHEDRRASHMINKKERLRKSLDPNRKKTQPNVQGQVTNTWKEAADLAYSKGLDHNQFIAKSKKEGEK